MYQSKRAEYKCASNVSDIYLYKMLKNIYPCTTFAGLKDKSFNKIHFNIFGVNKYKNKQTNKQQNIFNKLIVLEVEKIIFQCEVSDFKVQHHLGLDTNHE